MLNRNLICTNEQEFIQARAVTFLNPYSYLKLFHSGVDLSRFDRICIDGIALKIFLDLFSRGTRIERMSFDFTSIANLVFSNAAEQRQHGFVIGSDHLSNKKFLTKISSMFPGITLEVRSGFFNNKDEQLKCIAELAASQHDFVIIGMGAVKQEEFAIALLDAGFRGRIYTCGGFIHQTAMGDGQYYPTWIDNLNLRFVYRMFKEPSTIRRYLIDYPKAFVLLFRNINTFKY